MQNIKKKGNLNISFLRFLKWFVVASIILLAMALRAALFPIDTPDYKLYISWYDFIHSHGGFAALKYSFANYNASYLYLLALATYIPLSKTIIIKLISVIFDYLLALITYLIVRLKYERLSIPIMAGLVVLLTPTVVINGALWGQCDSIYASCSLGGLYFLLRKQPLWAFILFGLALSFKPQALFLFPLLFVLLITGEVRLKFFLIIPAVYLITMLPACLIGRNFIDLLTTYKLRLDNPRHVLVSNAPTLYQWIPWGTQRNLWEILGLLLTCSAIVVLSFVVFISRRKMTHDILVKLALVFVLMVPFLLPEMHDRYFYLADVISLIYAFYFPDYFYVAVLNQLFSLISYIPFLVRVNINQQYNALIVLALVFITIRDLIQTLSSEGAREERALLTMMVNLGSSAKSRGLLGKR